MAGVSYQAPTLSAKQYVHERRPCVRYAQRSSRTTKRLEVQRKVVKEGRRLQRIHSSNRETTGPRTQKVGRSKRSIRTVSLYVHRRPPAWHTKRMGIPTQQHRFEATTKFPQGPYHFRGTSPSDKGSHSGKHFQYLMLAGAGATTGLFAKNIATSFISYMSAARNVISMANVEIDISEITKGSSVTFSWRSMPLFIRHRTQEEVDQVRTVDITTLRDPELDEKRTIRPEWIVMLGICTHLGCVPVHNQGDYGGWFCPCHGSHYDVSGRIRKGPAPKNLAVPTYTFLNDTKLFVGDLDALSV